MRRRFPLLLAVILVAGSGAVAAFWLVVDDDRDPREGSEVLDGARPVEITRTPASYRIVYRVEDYSGDDIIVSTDEIWVRRPFESRLETRQGGPPGERLLSVQIAEFGRLQAGGPDRDALTSAVPPRVAPSDVRLDDVLSLVVERDLVEVRESRRILGRDCQIYRTAGPVSAGALVRGTHEEYADSCVDAAGLVLEEIYVLSGRTVSRKVAVEVDEGAAFASDAFDTANALVPLEKGGGSVREVVAGSRPPGRFFELSEPISRFELEGRYAVVPPQPEAFTDATQRIRREASVVDVYVDDVDVVFVERGSTLGGVDPFPGPAQEDAIPLTGLGDGVEGELLIAARGSEVRALVGGGYFVRVAGTIEPHRLVEIASSLVEVEGGGLIYVDEPAAS